MQDDDEDQEVYIEFEINFDDPEIILNSVEEQKGLPQSINKENKNNGRGSMTSVNSNIYSDDVIYAPDNVIFDMQFEVCLGYMLSLKNF